MPEPLPIVVVLGLDADGKPHAARFFESDAKGAASAATAMGYHAVRVTDAPLREVASTLPAGKLLDGGRAVVPFVKRDTFIKLATLVEGAIKPAPKATDKAEAGEPLAEDEPDDTGKPVYPLWSAVEIGAEVLAAKDGVAGWWEANVVAVGGNGEVLTVRWRDAQTEPPFMVLRRKIALKHPLPKTA
jgi:hypothetical protein